MNIPTTEHAANKVIADSMPARTSFNKRPFNKRPITKIPANRLNRPC